MILKLFGLSMNVKHNKRKRIKGGKKFKKNVSKITSSNCRSSLCVQLPDLFLIILKS